MRSSTVISCGQHQTPGVAQPDPGGRPASRSTHVEPVHVGKRQIETHEIERRHHRQLQRRRTVVHHVDGVSLSPQGLGPLRRPARPRRPPPASRIESTVPDRAGSCHPPQLRRPQLPSCARLNTARLEGRPKARERLHSAPISPRRQATTARAHRPRGRRRRSQPSTHRSSPRQQIPPDTIRSSPHRRQAPSSNEALDEIRTGHRGSGTTGGAAPGVPCWPEDTVCSKVPPGVAKTLAVRDTRPSRPVAAFSRDSSSPPTSCPPTWWAPASTESSLRDVRHRARSGVRQLRAGRRDQPGTGQGAVGPARGYGRAPGHASAGQTFTRLPIRSSCSPPRTPSRTRACTPLPEAQRRPLLS